MNGKSTGFNLLKFLLPLTILATMLTGCFDLSSDNKAKEKKDKEEVAIPVRTTEVIRGPITASYPTTTTLEPENEASVVSKVGGVVEKFYVEEGDIVKAGQPLVQIETDRLRLELARAESDLNKMKNELKRTEAIYKRNLVSSESYEKLKFEYESQKAAYDLSKLELNFATVTAPIDGVISKRYVKVGNMIRENEAVYHITDFDPLHAVLYVPEKELSKIKLNQIALLYVDAQQDKHFNGYVKRISPVVDAKSGTFKVTVEVADNSSLLKPGMFGRLQVIYDERPDTILVDKKSVLSEDKSFWVYVVRDGRAFKQLIEPGYVNEQYFEVRNGLQAADIVVNMGQNSLKNDVLIDVVEGPGKQEMLADETTEAPDDNNETDTDGRDA